MMTETKNAEELKARELPPSEAALPAVIPPPAAESATPTPKELTKLREGMLGVHLMPEHIELLKSTMMQGATDDEVAVFAYVCNRTGLEPVRAADPYR